MLQIFTRFTHNPHLVIDQKKLCMCCFAIWVLPTCSSTFLRFFKPWPHQMWLKMTEMATSTRAFTKDKVDRSFEWKPQALAQPWSGNVRRAKLALSAKAVNCQLHLVLSDLAVCATVTVQKEANGVGSNLKLWAGTNETAAHRLALGSAPVKLHGNQPDNLVVTNLQEVRRHSLHQCQVSAEEWHHQNNPQKFQLYAGSRTLSLSLSLLGGGVKFTLFRSSRSKYNASTINYLLFLFYTLTL